MAARGLWKVEVVSMAGKQDETSYESCSAPGRHAEEMIGGVMTRCGAIFGNPTDVSAINCFQTALPAGMIRCSWAVDKVVGFVTNIKAMITPPTLKSQGFPQGAQPGPRIMHGAEEEPFRGSGPRWKSEWTPQIDGDPGHRCSILPIIGTRIFSRASTASERKIASLCESSKSVFAIPDRHRQRSQFGLEEVYRSAGENVSPLAQKQN